MQNNRQRPRKYFKNRYCAVMLSSYQEFFSILHSDARMVVVEA